MIEVEGVAKCFPVRGGETSFTAIRDVTFSLDEGEFVALVGPSGCGKSTLLNMISGLDPASEGDVSVCGKQVGSQVRDDVGYLFQTDALLDRKRAVEGKRVAVRVGPGGR